MTMNDQATSCESGLHPQEGAQSGPFLSIIIPAYREEKRIGPALEKIFVYLDGQNYTFEVIVVNDASPDNTAEVARNAGRGRANFRVVSNEFNRGKGASVRRGMMEARGDFLLFSDADLSTPIEETERFLNKMQEGCGVVIGSRALRESNIVTCQPWHRQIMGKTFNKIVRVLLVRGLKDTQCGFKMFTREAAKQVFPLQRIERFAFDVEVLFLAQRLGFRIYEMPVTWIDSPNTSVRMIRDSFSMFAALLQIRLNSLRGLYKRPLSFLQPEAP
jgi:dolichyl-phosphate beta-glucosyltransferase